MSSEGSPTTPGGDDRPHPRFARMYMRMSGSAEERGARGHRKRLLAGLAGTVVELGCGSGLNFPHYPASATEVIGVEPEPTLRAAAEKEARDAPVAVRVVPGTADDLPLADSSVDAAVASLVLCSVPDQQRALVELRRVLRPGGELRFYEHVIANRQPKRALLQLGDASRLWPAVAGGCHAARDTTTAIEKAGFDIESIDRFGFRATRLLPMLPHILGTARRT